MAIAISNLGRGAGNDTTSFNSDSVSPSANSLILVNVYSRTGITADPNQPTLSGNGLTWVAIATTVFDNASSSRRRITLFRAMGASPSAGVITVDFGGQTQTHCGIIIDQATGTDTTGTDGSGAIVQSATNRDTGVSSTSLTVTLAAFSDVNNATYGAFATSNNAMTPGSGFTELFEENVGGAIDGQTEYTLSNDTTVDVTYSSGVESGGIAVEIKAPSSPPASTFFPSRRTLRGIGY